MKKQTKTEELAFEAAFAQLEEIVGKLEAGDLPLDEALALFEQGQKLATCCGAKLDEVEVGRFAHWRSELATSVDHRP